MSPPAVQTQALCKTYRIGGRFWQRKTEKTTPALVDVDLEIAAGEVFGLVGRNGYGKTTLVKCVASLLLPTSGAVKVFGQDTRHEHRSLRRRLGWVGTEERSFYFRLTGAQNLRFFGRLQGLASDAIEKRMRTLSERFKMEDLLSRRFHEYSTGNRHKLAIIRGLLHDPKLLMLDEPTRSLDPFAAHNLRETLLEWVKEDSERTIIITSHNLNEIETLSDRVGIMSRGRLRACGAVEALREQWGGGERIGIRLAEQPRSISRWKDLAKNLHWEPLPAAGGWLRFDHIPGDDALNRLLDGLREEKHSVLSVERDELSLQDIVDRVDRDRSSDGHESSRLALQEIAS